MRLGTAGQETDRLSIPGYRFVELSVLCQCVTETDLDFCVTGREPSRLPERSDGVAQIALFR